MTNTAFLLTGYRGLDGFEWMRLKWWQKLLYKWRQHRSVTMQGKPKYLFCQYVCDRAKSEWLGESLIGKYHRTSCQYKKGKVCHCRCDEDGTIKRWFDNYFFGNN